MLKEGGNLKCIFHITRVIYASVFLIRASNYIVHSWASVGGRGRGSPDFYTWYR